MEIDVDSANALEEHVCPHCGERHTHRFQWDWGKFFVGKISNKFIAWLVYMVFQFIAILSEKVPYEWTGYILTVSTIVTGIFMLAGAIDIAVENAKITADFKAGLSKQINKTVQGDK